MEKFVRSTWLVLIRAGSGLLMRTNVCTPTQQHAWVANESKPGRNYSKDKRTAFFIFVPTLQTSGARFRIFTVHSAHGGI
jgi:hypothetical protein